MGAVNKKLTPETVAAIRDLRAQGASYHEIAKQLSVSPTSAFHYAYDVHAPRLATPRHQLRTRPCKNPKCGTLFAQRHGAQKYCKPWCSKRLLMSGFYKKRTAERAMHAAKKPERHPKAKYVYAAVAEAEPGMCPWGCERKLPPKRKYSCGLPECEREYYAAWSRGRHELERKKPTPSVCKCGCGPFQPNTVRHIWKTDYCHTRWARENAKMLKRKRSPTFAQAKAAIESRRAA